jgi:hypothetical protein
MLYIYDSNFYNCKNLTSINLPQSLMYLGQENFSGCSSLTSITLPDSIFFIADKLFTGCSSLSSIAIPDLVQVIEKAAFNGCSSLASVTFPNVLKEIKYGAFQDCKSLESITIPDSVNLIEDYAFAGCSKLKEIEVKNVTPVQISSSVFNGVSTSNCILRVPVGAKSAYQSANVWKNFSIILEEGEIQSDFVVANGVLTKYTGAGGDIVIPDNLGITSIGNNVFSNNKNISSVIIPEGTTHIGENAFADCSNLTSVTFPNFLSNIGNYSFSNCTALQYIAIPNSVTNIAQGAFSGSGLVYVTVPNSVTSISNSLFYGCKSLVTAVIPNTITTIGTYAFNGCSSLTYVIIPASVTSLGDRAFYGCTSLTKVEVPWATPLSVSRTLFNVDYLGGCTLVVPRGTTSLYRADEVWQEFGSFTEEGHTAIPTLSFADVSVYVSGNEIRLNSPAAERISIYSTEGRLLLSFVKPAGDIAVPVKGNYGKILIVKGGSGWVKKVVR